MLKLIEKTAEYVKKKLMNEPTGHDWYHTERVWKMAKRLHAEEGGDRELIELAALMHDLGDNSQFELDDRGSLVLHGMMDVLDIEHEKQEKIIKIANELRYYGDSTKPASTLESKIVQDADWLDSLGAIGIARVFATGGRIKRLLHDPKRKIRKKLTKNDYLYRKKEGTSFNYFFEKPLKAAERLNTKTAREIAKHRIKYTKDFLAEFLSEWDGKK
ncbi:HD domain-containing protein [Patescibacteria group bacterium]|nr:HD domain-containing protein [Patescibacteria group bacterium]MBU1613255.1 HD domain-containing protein [Patescibacteria group bacterium]